MARPARPKQEDRRLAAILVADVVDSTDMIGRDEHATRAAIRRFWETISGPIITQHKGNVFKTNGDGFLVEFPSAVEALRAAILLQERSHTRPHRASAGPRVRVRIGLHHDDVVAENGDLFGLGVNIAARLCPLAPPGGICISQTVLDATRGRLSLTTKDLGQPELKGIRDPIRVYRVVLPFEPPETIPEPPPFPPQDPLGPRIEPRDDSLDIQEAEDAQGTEIANSPLVRQMHPPLRDKAQAFADAAARMDNYDGWNGIANAAQAFHTAINCPTAKLAENLGSIYSALVSLATFANMEIGQRQGGNRTIDTIPAEHFRAFEDVVVTAAPLFRRFPTVAALDDELSAFFARPNLLELAANIIALARREQVLTPKAADELSALVTAGQRGNTTSDKAATRGVRGVRNMLYRAGSFGAGFMMGALSSGYANESPLVKNITRFMAAGETAITEFLADRSADVRYAFDWLFAKQRGAKAPPQPDQPIATQPPPEPPSPEPWPPLTPLSVWRDRSPDLPDAALPEMITLPAGDFLMGASAEEAESEERERPQRRVHVPSFALGRCAVTFRQWDAACDAGADLPRPEDRGWGRGDRPVINVSWEDAQAYCAWLNGQLGLKGLYRLPTEAEWEYACRAGTVTPFSFGATISTAQANFDGNYVYGEGRKGEFRERTVSVGSLPANAWGLHEMHGNVWEWVADAYRDSYQDAPLDGSRAVTGDDAAPRVLRGGSWNSVPWNLRSASRFRLSPVNRSYLIGFRLARTL